MVAQHGEDRTLLQKLEITLEDGALLFIEGVTKFNHLQKYYD
jgi:hypothetical protein